VRRSRSQNLAYKSAIVLHVPASCREMSAMLLARNHLDAGVRGLVAIHGDSRRTGRSAWRPRRGKMAGNRKSSWELAPECAAAMNGMRMDLVSRLHLRLWSYLCKCIECFCWVAR